MLAESSVSGYRRRFGRKGSRETENISRRSELRLLNGDHSFSETIKTKRKLLGTMDLPSFGRQFPRWRTSASFPRLPSLDAPLAFHVEWSSSCRHIFEHGSVDR